MLQNLLKTLQEQTPGLDGAVNHDEFKPSDTPLPIVVPLDAEQREDLVSYVVQNTSSGHTYMTAKGQRGVVYYDERGRASSSIMDEMTDEMVVFLAKQKGYEFPPAEGLVSPMDPIPQQESIRSEVAGILDMSESKAPTGWANVKKLKAKVAKVAGVKATSVVSNMSFDNLTNIEIRGLDKPRDVTARMKRAFPEMVVMIDRGSVFLTPKGKSESLDEEAPTLKQKPGEDYWFVMFGGKKVGGVSKDSSGKFDGAKRSAPKDDAFKKGFSSKEAAAAWVSGSKTECLNEANPSKVWKKLKREFSDWTLVDLKDAALSTSPRMDRDARKVQSRYQKLMDEEVDDNEVMAAHKKAGRAMATVNGTGRQFGDGWSSSVPMGSPSGDLSVYLSVGINAHPASGGYVVWLGVDLSGFGQDRGRVAKEVERKEIKRTAALLKRYSSEVTTVSAQNGVSRAHAIVPGDKIQKAVKALPSIAKKFAQDVWKTRMSAVTEETEPIEERIQVIPPYAYGIWVVGVEDALKKKLGKKYTWKKPILTSGSNTLIYKWYARKGKGELLSRQFISTIKLDPGADLFDLKLQVVDSDGQVVQEKNYRHIFIDQAVDSRFLTDWIRK